MDNITLRNPSISRTRVEEAAKLIDVHDFIMRLPGGYDYNVMERGSTLSLGQRQLIAFIRALLYNPSILILDEATSSIDTESEMLIQQAIDKLISRAERRLSSPTACRPSGRRTGSSCSTRVRSGNPALMKSYWPWEDFIPVCISCSSKRQASEGWELARKRPLIKLALFS